MTRDELADLLRKASTIAHDGDILVVGSQAILGSLSETDLPARATMSMEADLVFLHDRDRRKADRVNGVIGELSAHHVEWGTYAEGVHREMVLLPRGWRQRTIAWHLEPASTRFLERHDLCAAKLARGVQKDLDFVGALIDADIVHAGTLLERVEQLDASPALVAAAVARARAFI